MRPSGGFLWKSDSVKARQPIHRLVLEALEDRLVPAQIFVTTPDDVVDQADGLISLREAIQQANLNPDHDDIFFPNTVLNYQVKLNTPTNFGPTAFVISSDIAIRPSPGTTCTLSISPNAPPMRFFWVQPTGNLQLSDLTIIGGRIQGGSGGMGSTGTTGDIDGAGGGGGAGLGGAIYNQGTLNIERVTFIDNQAKGGEGGTGSTTTTTSGFGGGGGSLSGPGQPGTSTSGGVGAINAGSGAGPFGTGTNGSMGGGGGGAGSITSAKGGNGGFGGGGGAYGGLGGYGAGNGAPTNSANGGGGGGGAGMGGAIFNESGNITISNSTFIDNQAFGGLAGSGGGKGFGIGGAIANLNGNVTISSSTFSANSNGAVNNAAEQAGSLVNIAINGLTANVVSRNSIFETSLSTSEFASFQASGSTATFSGNNNIVFNGSLSSPLGIISNSSALLGTTVIAPTGALVVPLTPGSPAIGAATPTGVFPFDQRQIKRQMAPSIGAYEYYAPPTSINISASSFAGALENGELIGTISAIGPFAGTSFSFSLVEGIGDTNNADFYIRNNELVTTGKLPVGNYSICVRATGAAGDSYDQAISLVAKSDILVNTANDIVDPLDGKTSLREAIAEANLNPDHDRITFDNALGGIPVVLESVGSTAEGNSALVVSTAISIHGLTTSTDFRINSSSEMRFFRVETTGNLRLENIDLSGGLARGNKSGDVNGKGGAILAHGPVSLIRSSIIGAKVYGAGGANPGDAMGGAIYTTANLDLLESTLADNTLFRGNDSTVAGQYTPSSSGNYYGAGIYAEASLKPISLNFQAVTIARNQGDNQANFAGGAIAIAPGLTPASGTIFFNANSLVVQSDGNPSDIDILPGLGLVEFNALNSFAGTLGSSVPTNGFTIGDPLLDYSTSNFGQSPVFRPQAGSPLIHAISNPTTQTDQTNLKRFSSSAAGAAEYYMPPQSISSIGTQLAERLPAGIEAGTLQTSVSTDSGNSFKFELVTGLGDTDNNAFRLEQLGDASQIIHIFSNQSFLAADGNRSIRVRVTGPTGLFLEQIIGITITPSIVVDTANDITDPNDGKISLREALAQATNQPGIDRISFTPSLAGQTVRVGPDPTSMASTSAFVVNSSVLISGRDAPGLIIQPTAASNIRFFNVSAFRELGLEALTLQGGNVIDGEGGAIFSDGGNIYLDSVTVRNNKASQMMAAGGAIRINSGRLQINNSTFFNNSVENATGVGAFVGEGGHILAINTGTGLYPNDPETHYSISNSTFYNGSATGTTGGVLFIAKSSKPTKVDVTNSAFAHATGDDISFTKSGPSTFDINFNSNSVESSAGLPSGINFIIGDPMLGPLANNGGPTPTMEPLPGSPLIASTGVPPSTEPDQRGIIRGSNPTIGAYQVVQATNVSFTPLNGTLGIGSKAVFKIDFSHPVTYYGQPAFDLNVSGAQAFAPAQPNGSVQSSFITLQYTVREGDSTNNLTASHANAGTFDVRDGVNHAVLIPQYNLVTGLNVDGIRPAPTLTLTPNAGATSNALTFSGTISFSEPVSGALLANDFKLTNATVSGISGPDAAGNYSFTLTPVADGKVSVAVIAPGITDGAGNSSAPSNAITFFSDKSPPAAQISINTTAGGLTNINNLNGKITFGEPVTGTLSVNDFTVVNATVSNISGPDANGIYTFNLNPTANGLVAVSLNAPSITDLAGNSATPASPFDFTFDNSSATPTVFLNPVPNNASNALSFFGSVAFGETVTGTLLSSDFKLTNANVSDISGPNAIGNYSFTLTPVSDGKVSVEIIASGITDTAGNSFTPSNLITFKADYTPPAAVISLNVVAGSVTNANKLNGKVTFGEPVTGNLSVNDFTVVNATISTISGPDANGIYTFNLNPIANGLVAVSLNAANIIDVAANSATPASPFDFTFDNSSATPAILLNPVPNNASNALSFSGSVAFGETVTGTLLSSDFKLTNATVSAISGPNATGNYSFTLTPVADGEVSVEIFASGITDTAGNSFTPSNAITFQADYTPPAAVISLNVAAGGFTNINNLNGKVSFGEPVTGNLSVNDFTVVNASVSNISGPDANGIYTFTLNPTANGNVAVSLNAPNIKDVAGNSATSATAITFVSDTLAPVPTISLNPAPTSFSSGTPNLSSSGGNSSFTSSTGGGSSSMNLSGGGQPITDSGTNLSGSSGSVSTGTSSGTTVGVSNNTALTTPNGELTYSGTISFNEPVSGTLLASDFKLTNATVSAISGPNAAYQYHFTLAPISSGSVELRLNPNTVVDLAGNGSAISNLISFNSTIGATVDTTPPTLLSIGTGKISNPTTYVPNQKFLVTFSEPVLGIDPFDFSIITNNEFIPLPLPAMAGQNLIASLTSITSPDGGPLTGRPISSVLVTVNSSGRGTLSLELSPAATIADAAGNQIAAPGESVSYGYFSVDTTPLLVLSVGEIASPRTTPVDSISIELSKPLSSPMQLEPAIRLLRNDKNFPLGNSLLITQTGYASYSVSDLGTRTGVEGTYQFLVSGANLRDSVGNLGTGLASSTWVSDGPLNVVAPAEFNPPVNFYQFATNIPKRVLLASFTDINGGSISDYEAHVNWGESGSSIPFDQLEALEILPSLTQPNTFDVFGTHTYTLDRNYLANVLIKDSAEGESFLFGFAEAAIVALTPSQINQQNLSTTTPVFVRGDINSSVLALSLFPDANANKPPLIQAVFNQVPGIGIDERALFLTGYARNPERKPLPISTSEVASVNWLDLRASGVDTITDPTAFVNASFAFTGRADQSIQLFYFNPLTNTYDRVFSSGGNAPVVDLATGTVVVLFDSTSTPTLANLNGTVFAVTVSAPTSASNPPDTTTPVIAPTTPTTVSQTTSTTSASLVQASQTLSELARSDKMNDSNSGVGSSAFFVGGRSSTVSLTPSALGRGVSARTRSSAGARTLMASSKDAAMALGSILRGVIAPVEQKLKPWIEAFSTDNVKPIPMPGGAKPAPMAPAAQQAQPPAGAVAPQPNMQTSSIAMPDVQHLVAQPVQHAKSEIDADEVWLEPMSLEYSAGLLPLAGALVLTCSDVLGRKKSRKWTEDDHAQGASSDESFS